MSHSNTVRMLAYWESRRAGGDAPARASINPADFADILTQAFMVGHARGAYPLRLVGALMDRLHEGRLLGSDFFALWADDDRAHVHAAIESAVLRAEPLRIRALGRTAKGLEARIEILLMPLADRTGRIDRLLGHYQPVSSLRDLQDQPIEALILEEITMHGDGETTRRHLLRLAAVNGRNIA